MIAITPYQLRRPSAARPGFGMQRRHARRPYRGVRQDAGHIGQPQCADAAAKFRVAAISGVHQHHTERQASCTGRTDLLERDLGLGPEADKRVAYVTISLRAERPNRFLTAKMSVSLPSSITLRADRPPKYLLAGATK